MTMRDMWWVSAAVAVNHRCGAWVQKDLTSSWTPYLPSLPSYFNSLLPRPSPILEIAIDSERNILYTRSQNSSIQVRDASLIACIVHTHAYRGNTSLEA